MSEPILVRVVGTRIYSKMPPQPFVAGFYADPVTFAIGECAPILRDVVRAHDGNGRRFADFAKAVGWEVKRV